MPESLIYLPGEVYIGPISETTRQLSGLLARLSRLDVNYIGLIGEF